MSANYTPNLGEYTELRPFRYWCQKVMPLVYDDSLSYYELLCKVVDYLNKTMHDVDTLHTDVVQLHAAYVQLQQYVNTYFENLDIQPEIDRKLDEMAESGTLLNIIKPSVIESVNSWLKTHITNPSNPPIDKSLTIENAAADSKVTGDKINSLKDDKVSKYGVGEVTKVNTNFIINNAIYVNPKETWKAENTVWSTHDIVIDGILSEWSVFNPNLYAYIGYTNGADTSKALIRIYYDDNGVETQANTVVIDESKLGTLVEFSKNGKNINKIVIQLYSSTNTSVEVGQEFYATDIVIKETNGNIEYKFNGVKIDVNDVIKNESAVITVKPSGGDYNNPVKATNDIFQRAWNGEKFVIEIYEGTYDIYASWEEVNRTSWFVTGANVGWNTHKNIKIVGVGDRDKIICNCFLPDDADSAIVEKASCINANFGAYIENVTFVSKNTRYCCHADNSNYYQNLDYTIKNCVFKHLGNKEGFWLYHGGWMEGASSGNTYLFEDCEFEGVRSAYGFHTSNNNGGYTIGSIHKFINCKFMNTNTNIQTVGFECMSSGRTNRVYMNGCYINNKVSVTQNPSDADIDIEIMMSGCSNVPIDKSSEDINVYVM